MRRARAFLLRLRNSLRGHDTGEQEMRNELENHLDLYVADKVGSGIPIDEARRQAFIELGGLESAKDAMRDRRGLPFLDTLARDVRYAARTLRRSPAFTLAAVATLALGIGANTAVFTVIEAVVLRPLPYADSDGLVWIHDGVTQSDRTGWPAAMVDYLLWKQRAKSFEKLAAFAANRFSLTGDGEPEQLPGAAVSADFFSMLGVRPLVGRTFAPDEDQPGHTPTALISERLWERRYNRSPNVLGKSIVLNGRPATVIGVLPAGFHFRVREADIWSILMLEPPTRRGPFFIHGVAKLRPGVTLEQANREMDALGREVESKDPKKLDRLRYPTRPLLDELTAEVKPLLRVIAATVAVVLLIAVFNVANLMLSRAASRRREIAIRLSIGASRSQLVRQMVTESVVLSSAAGLGGLIIAQLALTALRAFAPPGLPRLEEISIDTGVLLFTAGVSLLSGILFGLAPVFAVGGPAVATALKSGERGSGGPPASQRFRNALVVAEISLSVVLLIGAGLLIRSFNLLGRVQPGFDAAPERLLITQVAPSGTKYREPQQVNAFWDDLTERVRQTPGVEAAAIAISVPPDRTAFRDEFEIPGRTPPEGGPPVPVPFVSREYFQTFGIPVLRGRTFDSRDTTDSPRVTVISHAMARRYFGNEDPVGKRLKHGGRGVNNALMEIIGVVGDVRYLGLAGDVHPVYYELSAQVPVRTMWLVVRTRGEAMKMLSSVREQIRAIDPNVPAANASSMALAMHNAVDLPRFRSSLMAFFAIIALALAIIGVYGVIAYSVLQRRKEIGIRMALGATKTSVARMVVGHGSRLAVAGVLLGLVGALAAARMLKSMLYGVTETDAATFGGVAVLLTSAALLASYIPARRACKLDPLTVLREE